MNSILKIAGILMFAFAGQPACLCAQTSQWANYGQSGRLVYQMDHRGDRILDYSMAGYKMGAPIPNPENIVNPLQFVHVAPIAGDNRAQIQAAINQVSSMPLNVNGYRGVVQLAAGQYDISDTLQIGASGVILRGVGDGSSAASNTILRSISTNQIDMIEVGNFTQYANDLFRSGSAVNIIEKVVPAGVTSFRVSNTNGFKVGDWINVKRTPTQAWFDFMTEHFPDDPSGENYGWNTSGDRFTFQHERQITRIEGNRVFINAPLSHSIDPLSNGTIEHYTDKRVSNVGIQGIRGTSIFDASETGVYDGRTQFDDEDHASNFVQFSHAEDSWATDITGEHLSGSAVAIGIVSRSITVQDAKYLSPVSEITGGRRYAFNINGSLSLMQNLEVDSARRAFINNSTFNGFNRGPNVFFNGVSTDGFVRSGPHANYSTGALYDNLHDDSGFEARRASDPISHGWRGGHTVIWNSESPEFQITSPPGSNNYLIGATGDSSSPDPNGAVIDSFGQRIEFNDLENPLDSLYFAQRLENERFPFEQSREYWVGDFDELESGDAEDQVYVDPAWLTAIDSLSSPFHSSQPITQFDDDVFGRRVPFTLEYDLASTEVVTSAVLTIGMKRRGGASSDDDLLWLDSTSSALGFTTEGWGPIFENGLQVLTLELLGDLTYLQAGQLNGVLSNNRAIDWVHLLVNVVDESLLPDDADFNGDGFVDGADFLAWQRGFGQGTTFSNGDADHDGDVDSFDLAIWQSQYGGTTVLAATSAAVPEPNALTLVLIISLLGNSLFKRC
ncbi:hypothetical protein [Bythopirellula polymerisocia]|uniref:Uncharacterized protein n=1 Tax=Bythopirellula polymerisocia TaxID=2528003 RepID=A0A5C6CB79_9BACT|nr:hypothetical protein [Bythopirellula polymerisocia]TWU21342.1 hypothetical protein Pla144_45620 [Bythopirellula polymerisocia]